VLSVKTIALTYARKLWRRRWFAAGAAWVFCLIGWGYVIYLPNIYEAKARIYVDTDSMLRPLMRGIAVDTNILTQVDLMQRTLLSRPNLQKVSHMADLDLVAHTPAQGEEVINDLRRRTLVSGEGRNLFTLSYTGESRDTATKVVQSLLTVFVESNLGNSRKDLLSARNFIDEQLRDYARQLDAAEKRVADFKAKNLGFLPGESNYNTRLDMAKEELTKTQDELDDDRHKRDELTRQLATVPKMVDSISSGPDEFGAGPPLAGPADATGIPSTDSSLRVAELEQKIRTLLENYTDQHPDVIRARRLLDQAKQQAKEEQEKLEKSAAGKSDTPALGPRERRTTAPNPVYDQLQLQLVQLETTIASLESRVKRNQSEVERWQGLAKSVPEVAAEMAKLTRDYDVTKRAYDELLNRRESAKIGSDLETQTQTVQFRIVDPPEAPSVPVAPKRPLLLAVVLIGGLVAGGAFAFLLAQVDDSVLTVRQLKDVVPLPVLGAISMVTTPLQKRRRFFEAMSFVAACVVLVMVFAGIISIEALRGLRA
jgi:polysaccharide chain length determinant protein (PEP-CTERM system associated)